VIEQATAAFSNQDFATGSGPVRDVAVAQLRSVLPLLDAQMAPEVRPRLYLATARLVTQAGWMSFQVNQDEAARRLWMIALDIARDTDPTAACDRALGQAMEHFTSIDPAHNPREKFLDETIGTPAPERVSPSYGSD
jgi:hypothetical protein